MLDLLYAANTKIFSLWAREISETGVFLVCDLLFSLCCDVSLLRVHAGGKYSAALIPNPLLATLAEQAFGVCSISESQHSHRRGFIKIPGHF